MVTVVKHILQYIKYNKYIKVFIIVLSAFILVFGLIGSVS